MKKIQIMDTTLRDGEQTQNVSFTPYEKLNITKMLIDDVKVDRVEVGNARVSSGELKAIQKIIGWAKENNHLDKIEVLGFVDLNKSVDWLIESGGKVINLLCKGSLKHCEGQLRKTKEEHLSDIKKTVEYAKENQLTVNIYLEDWSNGMLNSKDYVYFMIDGLSKLNVNRIMLPDTLGILDPNKTSRLLKEILNKYPKQKFDYHAHNDYGLANANSLAAVNVGVDCIHVTVNGLGERTGNTNLDEFAVAIRDFSDFECNIDEINLNKISKIVQTFSGKRVASNKPITGEDVFTQTAGIHADGDKKGDLYHSKLSPSRFARERNYALGKLSGKASLEHNLKKLNIELDELRKRKVLKKIIELGDLKKTITIEDLPFIITSVLEAPDKRKIKVEKCLIITDLGKQPKAEITLKYNDKLVEEESEGDGGYDAFMNAIKKIKFNFDLPELIDYEVRIPPGGNTNALVETTITWKSLKNGTFRTKGVDSDQVIASVKATENMLNIISTKITTIK